MKEEIIQEQDVPIEEDDNDIPTDDVDFDESVEEEDITTTTEWDKDEFEEET